MENVADRSKYKLDRPLAELSDAELADLASQFPVNKPDLPLAVDEKGQERLFISDEGQVALEDFRQLRRRRSLQSEIRTASEGPCLVGSAHVEDMR